jgi:hypothetical protein
VAPPRPTPDPTRNHNHPKQASAKLKDPNTKKATKITLTGDYVMHIMTNGSLAVGE